MMDQSTHCSRRVAHRTCLSAGDLLRNAQVLHGSSPSARSLSLPASCCVGWTGVVLLDRRDRRCEALRPAPAPSTTKDYDMQPTLAVGYLRQYRSTTCYQLTEAERREVFVEQMHSDPAAFDALIRWVRRRQIPVVLVATPAHLSAVGDNETKLERLQRETGAYVVAADRSTP